MVVLAKLHVARRLLQLARKAEQGAATGLTLGPAYSHASARMLLTEGDSLSSGMKLLYICVSVFLIAISGLMAGLTLGLLSLQKMDVEVLKRSGTPKQRWLVGKIEPVISHPHFLLVSLLLVNAAAYETLPIFLDRLLNPVAAILISTTAVLLFGEIAPQAYCKKYGLEIGAYLSWFVRGLMIVTSPISYPIALLLDWLLGEEVEYFRRAELKALVDLHAEPHDDEESGQTTLTQDEVTVIQGALDMATKTAEAAMTPLEKVFMVSSDAVIDDDLLRQVIDVGHSRVPVYEGNRQNIIGLILVKELVLVDEDAGVRVRDLHLREIPFISCNIPMYDVMRIFRTGRSHMAILTRSDPSRPPSAADAAQPGLGLGLALVNGGGARERPLRTSSDDVETGLTTGLEMMSLHRRQPSTQSERGGQQRQEEAIGIITIEDVLEELLQQEIVDETDRYVDNLQTVRTTTLLSLQHLPPDLRKFLTRTFRAGSPANRAALQAALAAQSPFGSPSPVGAASTGPSSSLAPSPSRGVLQQKPVAVVAAVRHAASAASLAEDISVAGGSSLLHGAGAAAAWPPQRAQHAQQPGSPEHGVGESLPLLRRSRSGGSVELASLHEAGVGAGPGLPRPAPPPAPFSRRPPTPLVHVPFGSPPSHGRRTPSAPQPMTRSHSAMAPPAPSAVTTTHLSPSSSPPGHHPLSSMEGSLAKPPGSLPRLRVRAGSSPPKAAVQPAVGSPQQAQHADQPPPPQQQQPQQQQQQPQQQPQHGAHPLPPAPEWRGGSGAGGSRGGPLRGLPGERKQA